MKQEYCQQKKAQTIKNKLKIKRDNHRYRIEVTSLKISIT